VVDAGPTGFDAGCAIACGAVPCATRSVPSRTLLSSPTDRQILGIAADATTVYFSTCSRSGVEADLRSLPLAGGAPSVLVTTNVIVENLHVDGATLYYVTTSLDPDDPYTLFSIPITGGSPRAIAKGVAMADIVLAPGVIYFSLEQAGRGTVQRVARDGSNLTTILETTDALGGFAVDDTQIYWTTNANGGTLSSRALGGGPVKTLRTSTSSLSAPLVDGENLHYVEGTNTPATCRSVIMSIPKTGGEPRRVSPGTSGIDTSKLTADGNHLYWISQSPMGAVLRAVPGETPTILAAGQLSRLLALSSTHLYWVAFSNAAYEVRMAPKSP
jgi:hypothetical protein